MYASRLTKEDLIRDGINDITPDGRVIRNGYEIQLTKNNQGYFGFGIYKYDSEGRREKKPITRVFKYKTADGIKERKPVETYVYKTRSVGLHRAMWAWYKGEVPEGMIVDHRNNKHDEIEDYRLDNLQLLSPKDNLAKERPESTRKIPCKLDRPRSYYEEKLAKYEELYKKAKENQDAKEARKQRGNLSTIRARLRYWDSNRKEIEDNMAAKKFNAEEKIARQEATKELKKDLLELRYWKNTFKEAGNKTMWHECCKVEKIAKEKKEDAAFVVKHALDVLHGKFGGRD